MFRVRVTDPSGASRVYPVRNARCTIGRTDDNDIVLIDDMVSGYHCALEIVNGTCTIVDRGSSNGTWVNNVRLQSPHRVDEQSRIYVGGHLVELERIRDAYAAQPIASVGPFIPEASAQRNWRELHDRYYRYAKEWDERDRLSMLTLRAAELRKAQQWLRNAPPQLAGEITTLEREFIAASERVVKKDAKRRMAWTASGVIALGATLAGLVMVWPHVAAWWETRAASTTSEEEPEGDVEGHDDGEDEDYDELHGEPGADDPHAPPMPETRCAEYDESNPDAICVDLNQPIEHSVIPFETLEDVARRYDVSADAIAEWNLLNPDAPPTEGTVLKILHPKKRPLPQTRITYEVEPGETWSSLADRFGVPAQRLRDYNPTVQEVRAGTEIAVWIDPKPYKPRNPDQKIPAFHIDQRAQSIGQPDNGKLENGIQMPGSKLYTRRNPSIMWGSSLTIAKLQEAVATFRRDVDFDGEIILADISKKSGGHFDPHKSHQAGRDIDIWLPTLKGVYKTKYLDDGRTRPRKPHFEEVDWYATWGLVRALIQTGAVKYIFLDWRYQKYVYDAAVNMGATREQLDEWIQYPRHQSSPRGIFRHSQDHLSHIHVRFKCAQWESQCKGDRAPP